MPIDHCADRMGLASQQVMPKELSAEGIALVEEPDRLWKKGRGGPGRPGRAHVARTCGENLPPAVLRGHVDPLNFILPRGELTGLTAHLYQDPPIARVTNLLAQRAVLEIVQRLPNGKIWRILKLGDSTSRYDQLHEILRSFNTLRRHACSTSKPHAFTVHSSHASVARSSWRFL